MKYFKYCSKEIIMVLFHIITKIQSFYKENLKDYNNETIPNKDKHVNQTTHDLQKMYPHNPTNITNSQALPTIYTN